MPMRKKDRQALERIAANLKRGLDYVMSPRTALMMETTMQSTDVFTAPYYPDKRYAKIAKDIGSEFVLALTALKDLQTLLADQDKPQPEE